MALYALKTLDDWALEHLRRAEVDCESIMRVFSPKDAYDGRDIEVLFFDSKGAPQSADLTPQGEIVNREPDARLVGLRSSGQLNIAYLRARHRAGFRRSRTGTSRLRFARRSPARQT